MTHSAVVGDKVSGMPRWEPDAESRLRDAALSLFVERGYDAVTVADITERAGLARRTFFRHFPDKREVLYAGSHRLPEGIEKLLDEATPADEPMREAVFDVLVAAGEALLAGPDHQNARRAIIEASPELRERERSKFAEIAAAITRPLVRRGVSTTDAELLGALATQMFRSAYGRTLDDATRSFGSHFRDVVAAASTLTGTQVTHAGVRSGK